MPISSRSWLLTGIGPCPFSLWPGLEGIYSGGQSDMANSKQFDPGLQAACRRRRQIENKNLLAAINGLRAAVAAWTCAWLGASAIMAEDATIFSPFIGIGLVPGRRERGCSTCITFAYKRAASPEVPEGHTARPHRPASTWAWAQIKVVRPAAAICATKPWRGANHLAKHKRASLCHPSSIIMRDAANFQSGNKQPASNRAPAQ